MFVDVDVAEIVGVVVVDDAVVGVVVVVVVGVVVVVAILMYIDVADTEGWAAGAHASKRVGGWATWVGGWMGFRCCFTSCRKRKTPHGRGIFWLAYSPCLFIPTSLISSFALDLNFLAAFFFVDVLVVLVRFLFDQRASKGCGKVAAG